MRYPFIAMVALITMALFTKPGQSAVVSVDFTASNSVESFVGSFSFDDATAVSFSNATIA